MSVPWCRVEGAPWYSGRNGVAKRNKAKLWPSTAWYSEGETRRLPTRGEVIQHLERLRDAGELERFAVIMLDKPDSAVWWTFDAIWATDDGACVRARMTLRTDERAQHRDRAVYEEDSTEPVPGLITITADADRPWDYQWPSPATRFLPSDMSWSSGPPEYNVSNFVDDFFCLRGDEVLDYLHTDAPWTIPVITHDRRTSAERVMERAEPDLVDVLPPSLRGRVIELRVHGSDVRNVHAYLVQEGLGLRQGGATIYPVDGCRHALSAQDLCMRPDPVDILKGGSRNTLAERLTQVAAAPWRAPARAVRALGALRDEWSLEDEEQDTAAELSKAHAEVRKLTAALTTAQAEKKAAEERTACVEQDREEAQRAADAANHELVTLRTKLDTDTNVATCDQLRAELDAARVQLGEYKRQVQRLSRQQTRHAAAGAGPDVRGEQNEPPESWTELAQAAASLPHVAVDMLKLDTTSLRGQPHERRWLQETWRALCALDAYGALKARRGVDAVPHFSAYLRLGDAPLKIPAARYAASESESATSNRRFREARTFPVPRMVDASGRKLMPDHIRIGSGKPPAPRLHFTDDTAGRSGRVHIGYIGPHLPSFKTN